MAEVFLLGINHITPPPLASSVPLAIESAASAIRFRVAAPDQKRRVFIY
jgi:hypothetical protein